MNQIDFITEIQKHEPKMFGLAISILKNRDLAKDGLQESAIKLWNQRDYFQKVKNKQAYCMQIIKNWCYDELKRKVNNHLRLQDDEEVEEGIGNEKDHVNDTYRRIKSLIEKLPSKQRLIIQLKDFEGLDFEEISNALKMEQGSVRVNLSRARKRLKEMYLEQENKIKMIQNEE